MNPITREIVAMVLAFAGVAGICLIVVAIQAWRQR